jgi:hypothetical protein
MADSIVKDFYVYLHRRATDGCVFYVGKGAGRRAWQKTSRNKHWKNIVKKHGLTVEIFQSGLQEWAAFEFECDLIALYGRQNLCNLTDGGEGPSGVKWNYEKRKKASKTMSCLWLDQNYRQKMAVALKNPERTKKISASASERWANDEYKKKTIESMLKKNKEKEIREKKSNYWSNLWADEEFKAKRTLAINKANKQPERAKKIAKALQKTIVCIDCGKSFDGLKGAVDWLKQIGNAKADTGSLSKACNGKLKTAYGYTWAYAD